MIHRPMAPIGDIPESGEWQCSDRFGRRQDPVSYFLGVHKWTLNICTWQRESIIFLPASVSRTLFRTVLD